MRLGRSWGAAIGNCQKIPAVRPGRLKSFEAQEVARIAGLRVSAAETSAGLFRKGQATGACVYTERSAHGLLTPSARGRRGGPAPTSESRRRESRSVATTGNSALPSHRPSSGLRSTMGLLSQRLQKSVREGRAAGHVAEEKARHGGVLDPAGMAENALTSGGV